ncbi:MAG: 30S ribosomal protein S6e [Thermoplasmataceae archaeon]
MANSVAVIADPRTGKSYKKEVTPENLSILTGRKIGEEIDGIFFELPGYKLKITGGSTIDGFATRRDLTISGKKRILVTYSEGRKAKKGVRKRVTFRGSIIGSDISQLNLSILQYGPTEIEESEEKK